MKLTLKALRANTGMSMELVAKYNKISPKTLFNYENGHTIPKQDTAERLANFYKVPINDIFFANQHDLIVFQESFKPIKTY